MCVRARATRWTIARFELVLDRGPSLSLSLSFIKIYVYMMMRERLLERGTSLSWMEGAHALFISLSSSRLSLSSHLSSRYFFSSRRFSLLSSLLFTYTRALPRANEHAPTHKHTHKSTSSGSWHSSRAAAAATAAAAAAAAP